MLHFEDFTVGTSEAYGQLMVDEAEMLAFATEFDPQPMHLDPQSEQARSIGGLLASGWFTASANMRLMADHFILHSAGMGSPGVSRLKWAAPVRAGDRLSGTMTILDKKASASRPDRGMVNFRFELRNQDGGMALEQENLILFARRDGTSPSEPSETRITRPAPESFSAEPTAERLGPIETIRPGTILRLGTYRFTSENMIAFARRFDPQAFHLSEEAGKASVFGGLSASGWHTASVWMRTIIRHWQALEQEAPLPKRGPGFGFTDLVWRKPVLAGDTLTYFSRILDARKSASKPGWGIVTQRNYAFNQHGVPVFAFTGAALWEAGT
jgi:acyl dehydratase